MSGPRNGVIVSIGAGAEIGVGVGAGAGISPCGVGVGVGAGTGAGVGEIGSDGLDMVSFCTLSVVSGRSLVVVFANR